MCLLRVEEIKQYLSAKCSNFPVLKKASNIIQEVRSSAERNTSVDELCQSNSMKSSHYSISLAPKAL